MNVALLLFTCIVFASCSFSDSYLVGKTRDPFWAHRPYGRSNNNRRTTPTPRRYSNYNNNNNKLNNRFSNNIDNHLTEIKLKKFFHGDESKYKFQYPFFNNNNKNSFKWDSQAVDIMNKMKMPKLPPMPAMPKNTQMDMREWPEYIPPISMVKLPLDTPPAAIN